MPRPSKRILNDRSIDVTGNDNRGRLQRHNTFHSTPTINHHMEQILIDEDYIESQLDEGWSLDPTDHTNLMAEMFPDSTNHYLLSKHLTARGYRIINKMPMELNIEVLEDESLKDADFIFEMAHPGVDSIILTRTVEKYSETLPKYNPNAKGNNFFGRSYVVAVIDEFGKLYAISVSQNTLKQIPIRTVKGKPQLNLHRFNKGKGAPVKKSKLVYRKQNLKGRYSSNRKDYVKELKGEDT